MYYGCFLNDSYTQENNKRSTKRNLIAYQVNVLRHMLSILALSEYNLAPLLFSIYLAGISSLMTIVIIVARKMKVKIS